MVKKGFLLKGNFSYIIYQYLEHDTWKCVDITLKNVTAHDRNHENPKIYLEAGLRSGNVAGRGERGAESCE